MFFPKYFKPQTLIFRIFFINKQQVYQYDQCNENIYLNKNNGRKTKTNKENILSIKRTKRI